MIALLAALFLAQQPPVSDAPAAADVYGRRQQDLILLAARLGSLHRLNQVCPSYGQITVFRDRMMEVVDVERPPRDTKEAMIAGFNDGYRQMTERHMTCSLEAEEDFTRAALSALSISDRLAAPLGV
ncbi:TIGR02301 family protein [Parvularcula maris]|uniref:TIGR02301 family protein n=1 Tax=Parvularcula maris TaxID=2965077 RepID=A0A9X2L894_9PROT|nr:TIGR02301 family protein [Parvularcula maris]MCQ8184813.1 TIGR02301 family protein [Parvularcula maris]